MTLNLAPGFSVAQPVLCLSTDATDPLPAALEGAVYASSLTGIQVANDDSLFSAVERTFLAANGPVNVVDGQVNPKRQCLNSAVMGECDPHNVLGGFPQ